MGRTPSTMLSRSLDLVVSISNAIFVKVRDRIRSDCKLKMKSVIGFVGAIVTRALFATHTALVLYMLVRLYAGVSASAWGLFGGLCLLAIETIYTLAVRKGQEYRYVWPSCFFYLCSMVPCVWVIELSLLQYRIYNKEGPSTIISGVTIGEDLIRKLSEIGLMLVIIVGRWILPRGSITRDQLSALLLEYVAIAADILELFEAFEEKEMRLNYAVTLTILSVYSLSLVQFTIIFTTFKDEEVKNEDLPDEKLSEIEAPVIRKELKSSTSRKYLRKLVEKSNEKKEKEKTKKRTNSSAATNESDAISKMQLHSDVYGILAGIFMQDGPFLALRMYMIIVLNIKAELQFFFAGKNAVTIALLLYRLYAIQCKRKEDERTPYQRLRAASIAVIGMNRFSSHIRKSYAFDVEDINKNTKTRLEMPA